MSKTLISILLLLLTFSVYGEEVKKDTKRGDPKKVEGAIVGFKEELKVDPEQYGVSVVLSSALGQGTFVSNQYADNPYFGQALSLTPNYKNWGFGFSLNISASMEYTDSDSTTHSNQIMFSDLGLSASRGIYSFEDLGLSIRGGLKLKLPTSLASQKATLLFAPSLMINVNQALGDFSIAYVISYKKNFNRYTTPVISSDDLSDFDTYYRGGSEFSERGVEYLEDDIISTGSNNTSFSLSHSLMLNYTITKTISAGMSFSYSQAWVYRSFDEDEFTADNASSGRSYRDIMIGDINASWQINDMVGLSFGINTVQLPKTSDQKGFRFPWFNFSTPADNLSSFFLDINMTF